MAITVTNDGFIGMFRVPKSDVEIPKLGFASGDATNVSVAAEEIVATDATSYGASSARVNISNVDVTSGRITVVVIEHSRDNTTWQHAGTFEVDWPVGTNHSGSFVLTGQYEYDIHDGVTHYFRVSFFNAAGDYAEYSDGVAASGASVSALQTSAIFNGVSDIKEYAEVTNLTAPNASDPQADTTAASPALVPMDGSLLLKWDDMTQHRCAAGNGTCEGNHPMSAYDATGTNRLTQTIGGANWANLDKYVVYIYVANKSNPQKPADPFPVASDANGGQWYKLAETKDTQITVACPRDEIVAFWVGASFKRKVGDAPTPPEDTPSFSLYNKSTS